MMKKAFFIFFLILLYTSSIAQDQQTSGAQPDFPGSLLFDYGVNILPDAPDDFDIRIIRSRSIGFHYLYPIPFGDSQFSLHPGLGISAHNYTFSDNVTLSLSDSTQIIDLDNGEYPNVSKSKFSVHYVNIPVEFRFFAKEGYRGLTAALGGVVGRRIISYSKIKFAEDQYDKFRRDFNINPWRYGVYARFGFRGIMLTGKYMLSDIFEDGAGPEVNTITAGITISLF
jgi:hypothetical protein